VQSERDEGRKINDIATLNPIMLQPVFFVIVSLVRFFFALRTTRFYDLLNQHRLLEPAAGL
jgi:hypothetical protein